MGRGGGLGSMGSDNGSRRKQIHEEAVPMKVKGGGGGLEREPGDSHTEAVGWKEPNAGAN